MSDKQPKAKINIGLIWRHVWPLVRPHLWWTVLTFVAVGAATVLSGIIAPMVYQRIIDVISLGNANNTFWSDIAPHFMMLVVVTVTFTVLYRGYLYILHFTQSRMLERASNYAFKKLTAHSQRFFSDNFAGSMVAKTKRFVRSIDTMYDIALWNFWHVAIVLVGIFAVLFIENSTLGWIYLAWLVVFLAVAVIFVKYKVRYDIKKAKADSKVTGVLSDVITNILNVKIFSNRRREQGIYGEVVEEERKVRHAAWDMGAHRETVQGILMGALELGGMYFVIQLWLDGTVTIGFIVLFQLYLGRLFGALWELSRAIARFMEALTDAKEMVDIFEEVPDILDAENPEFVRIDAGEVAFNSIHFQYEEAQKVFTNFNLKIPSGQTVGLVGHSGSGKTTITNLLLRFIDVNEGSITIDGQDIRNITQDDLRHNISYVPQDPLLFHRTIKENIAYAKPDASEEEIIEAAKKAQAHDFIQSLPQGYDTLVGERGVKLSGGQRQRVAIARVMLEDAPVLILDEATSSLDSISESKIQKAFHEAMKGRTTLVIAHRLSTIKDMDRIIVLDNGEIVQDGDHDELVQGKGLYRELWGSQE